jgi:hypothetical protein
VKSGEVDPAALGSAEALALMLSDPILIRRPLIEVTGERVVGFDPGFIGAWIGLSELAPKDHDLETCRRPSSAEAALQDESAPK